MIVSKVNGSKINKELDFPKLMISTTGTIIFFLKEAEGTVLKESDSGYFIKGDHINNLYMEDFKDFEGSITLSNTRG